MILKTSTGYNLFGEIGRAIARSVYSFIGSVYGLIIDLANYQIFTDETIAVFSRRIYMLIGIFMLFKLTFSMISYAVNPDQMADKSKGFGSLIKNIIISLVLTVAVPYIFTEAYYVQRKILEDGTLMRLVLPADQSTDNSGVTYKGYDADNLSFLLFSQFVKPNSKVVEIGSSCNILYDYDESGKKIQSANGVGYAMNPACADSLKTAFGSNDGCEIGYKNYKIAIEYQDYTILSNSDEIYTCKGKYKDTNGEKVTLYIIDYSWLTCVITGIVVLLMLISICIDVAVRTVKLAFYQLIAPIPIIANCAPGSKPDGALQKWAKACINTYLDLFIRLFGLFLGMFVITEVTDTLKFEGIATIVIVIGVLVFVKQIPKIVTDITGLKFEGFTLNPFKKVENEALGGKQMIKLGKKGLGVAGGTAALLGRKGIAGLDSLTHGKGFWRGVNSVHGKGYDKLMKARETYAPNWAAAAKEKAQGREEVKAMNEKWTEGRRKAEQLRKVANGGDAFSVLDGVNSEGYKRVYNHDEFIRSRMALDKADEARKIYTRMSEATARGASVADAFKNEIDSYGEDYLKKYLGTDLFSKMSSKTLNEFIKIRDDNSKMVSGMEKVHDSLRKQYQDDARTEDVLKHIKYNKADPTTNRIYDSKTGETTRR